MKDVMETIEDRKTIRKFKGEVDEENLQRLLNSALRAPVTALGHSYTMILVKDEKKKKKLYDIANKQQAFLNATNLLFCVDIRRAEKLAEYLNVESEVKGYIGLAFGIVDASIAAENLVLAADGLGFGSCYIGFVGHNALDVAKEFDIPKGVLPIFGIGFGIPDEEAPLRPRIPLKYMVQTDGYKDLTPEEMDDLIDNLDNFEEGDPSFKVHKSLEEKKKWVGSILSGFWDRGNRKLTEALKEQGFI